MKIKYIISSISSLVCILGGNLMTINPVDAASLNFTYTLESTETISGSFAGDIIGNKVENIDNFEAVYSGTPGITFDTLNQEDTTFTLDFSEYELVARPDPGSANSLSIVKRPDASEAVIVSIPSESVFEFGNTINNGNLVVAVGTETTPEPGITMALALLSSFGCWRKLKKKQVPSS